VDDSGEPQNLTIRSFGILRAADMPAVTVQFSEPGGHSGDPSGGPSEPVNGSDAVFAAVAAAVWIDRGLAPEWPIRERIST
jgi:CO/xanthine dehydrogenase Mo-binding subunit